MENSKPPLGLTPECIHNRLRVNEILSAIWRYVDSDKSVPTEWIDELQRRVCFERKELNEG